MFVNYRYYFVKYIAVMQRFMEVYLESCQFIGPRDR